MAGIDFEAEGLLGDRKGKAREARLALLQELADQGVSLDELRRAVEEDRLVLLPVERAFDGGTDRYTAGEIAEASELDPEFLARLLQALGAPIPEDDERVYADTDIEAAKRAKLFLDAGLPEEGVLETSRLIGISMANLADANVDLVGEVFTEPGVDERELAMRYAAAARTMAPLLDAVVGLVESTGTEEIPPLRAGVARGQALGRGGDWYGRPVNLAARITNFAHPDSVVVDQAVKDSIAMNNGLPFEFSFAGKRRFKGIEGEVPVHRVRRDADDSR